MRGQAICRSCLFSVGLILAFDLPLKAFNVHSGGSARDVPILASPCVKWADAILISSADKVAADRRQHQWQSRYRSWQATRNIFIYLENFMQPEMSLPKSKRCVHCQ